MGNNGDERWLSRRELADRYGLPIKTLAQWASKGTGPAIPGMGRHVRYRLSEVIEWETARVDDSYVKPLSRPAPAAPPRRGRAPGLPRRKRSAALGGCDDPDHL